MLEYLVCELKASSGLRHSLAVCQKRVHFEHKCAFVTMFNVQNYFTVLPKIAPFSPGSDAFFPGDYFSLQCSIIHGDLPISIYWQHNNHTISTNAEIMISKMGSRSSVLTIESIRDYHAGNYSCFGRNEAGTSNHSVEVIVNGSNQ